MRTMISYSTSNNNIRKSLQTDNSDMKFDSFTMTDSDAAEPMVSNQTTSDR